MINTVQQSFNGGQMGPLLHSRADIDKYRAGGRTVDNFIPSPFGPLRKRPGFIYSHPVKTAAKKTRLVPFDLSSDDGYILEFGENYIRFIRNRVRISDAGVSWTDGNSYVRGDVVDNGGVTRWICIEDHVASDGGTPGVDDGAGDTEPGVGTDEATYWYDLASEVVAVASGFSSGFSSGFGSSTNEGVYEWPTDYAEEDLFDIQFAQVNDILYIVHPDYPVRTLSRSGDTDWRYEDLTFTWPPVRDINLSSTTLTASAVTGTITLTASAATFDSSMVGGYYQITHERPDDEYTVRKDLSAAAAASSAIKVRGEYQFRTNGVWTSTIEIETSTTGAFAGEEVQVRQFVGDQDENFVTTFDTGGDFLWVRINHVSGTTGSGKRYAILEAVDATISGWVKITAFSNATSVTADVGSTIYSTDATDLWNEGAFSDYRGHPRTVTLHELRLCFGGTATDRQTVWGSQTDDFPNFESGTQDDDSWRYQIASTEQNEINWMVSQKQLLIGSAGGEWVLDSGREENVITPTNVRARRHSNFGSEYRQALAVDAATLFIRAGGERMADFSYLFENDGYSSADLNLLSYDLTRGGILQSAYQKKRDPIVWAAVDGSSLACVAYNRAQQVTGWSTIKSPGNSDGDVIESVALIGRSGDEAEVWAVVRRTINSVAVRYVERLDSDAFDKQEDATSFTEESGTVADSGTNLEELIYLDCSYSGTGGDIIDNGDGTFTVGGFDHLVGESIQIYVDGARIGDTHAVDNNGLITFSASACTRCTGGMGYVATFRTLPFFNQLETGSTRGREVSLKKCMVRVYRSGPFTITANDDPSAALEVSVRSSDIAAGDPTPLRSDDFEVALESRHRYDPSVVITSDEPTPLTIEMMITKMEVYGS